MSTSPFRPIFCAPDNDRVDHVKYGPLGRSGLIVSRICLGGNSWGAKGRRGWGKFDEVEAPAYFKRALDVGINFFDTADMY